MSAPAIEPELSPARSAPAPFGAGTFVPLLALLGAYPAGAFGAMVVQDAGLAPAAYLAVLVAMSAGFGAAVGLGCRPLLRRAVRGEYPLPMTAGRLRSLVLVAAGGAAGLAAPIFDDGVREFWILHRRDLLRAVVAADPATADLWDAAGGDGVITTGFVGQDRAADFNRVQTAVNALHVDANRPDAYFRDTLIGAGVAPPDWASRWVHRAVPAFAALLAAAVAGRLTRIAPEPGAQAPAVGAAGGTTPSRSLRSGLTSEDRSER